METAKKEGMMQTIARVSPLAPFLFKPDKNPPKVSIRAVIFWGILVYALQAFLVVCIAALTLNDKIQETAIFKSPADAPVSARGAWNCTPLSSWDTRASWPGSGAAKSYEGAGGAFSAVGEAAMSASECKAKVKEAGFCKTFAEGYVGPTGKCCIWGACVNGDTELPPCGGLIEQDDGLSGYCDLEYFNTNPTFTKCFSFNVGTNECPGKAPPICNLPSPPANTGWKNPMMGYQKSTAVLDLAKLETKLLDMGTPVPVNDPDGWRDDLNDPRNENYKTMPFKTINYRLEVGQNSTLPMLISTECDKNVWCAQTHPANLTAKQIHDWQDGQVLVTMGASGIKSANTPTLVLSTCALLPSPELRQVFTTAHRMQVGACMTSDPPPPTICYVDGCACSEERFCVPGGCGDPQESFGLWQIPYATCDQNGECLCMFRLQDAPPRSRRHLTAALGKQVGTGPLSYKAPSLEQDYEPRLEALSTVGTRRVHDSHGRAASVLAQYLRRSEASLRAVPRIRGHFPRVPKGRPVVALELPRRVERLLH